MMKIVKVVSSMLANASQITEVIKSGKEYYFLYAGRYKWSITVNNDQQHMLYLYPQATEPINILAQRTPNDWAEIKNYLLYNAAEIKTRDAIETFMELYHTVSAKALDADEVLDRIIRGE